MSTPEHAEALRHLHAVAGEYGVTHDELTNWAVKNYGVASLADLDAPKLRGLAWKLDNRDVAATFRWKYRVTAKPNVPLFTQAGWDALTADADQVSARFRQ